MGVKILLNMIMRDELKAGVLLRGFENLKHIFQGYAIVDTGSVDNSIQATQDWMKKNEKFGKIAVKPWENHFGKARTHAIHLAYEVMKEQDPKGEHTWYAMFQDADNEAWSNDEVSVPDTDAKRRSAKRFPWNKNIRKQLKEKRVDVNMRNGPKTYRYTWMICLGTTKKIHPWKWLCSVHEYVDDCGSGSQRQFLSGGYVHSGRDGARGKDGVNKYQRDALYLNQEIMDPKCEAPRARLAFYLANSYKDAGEFYKAAEWYERRVQMGDFAEEIFHSYLFWSQMLFHMKRQFEEAIEPLMKAIAYFPHRLEAVNFFVDVMIANKRWADAWIVGRKFLNIPFPENELLFVEPPLYHYAFDLKMLMPCYWAGMLKGNQGYMSGEFNQYDENKTIFVGQVNGNEYKAIVQRLLKNDHLQDKSILEQYVRNTAGIWNEEEKQVLYKLIATLSGKNKVSQNQEPTSMGLFNKNGGAPLQPLESLETENTDVELGEGDGPVGLLF